MDDTGLRDEAVSLLRDLLRIDTSNPPGGETPAAELLKRYLEANGVACELVARDPGRANLLARIPGTGDGPSLVLMGHTDVVPADAEDWQRPPFAAELDRDGYIWGRGAVDMKNETATRAVAMAELARTGLVPRGDVVFIAEADEEDGTQEVGMEWLVEERPDLATDFAINEGGGERMQLTDGRVVVPINIGEKATLPVLVTALGEAGHASIPTSGANAVPRLATLIQRLAAHRTRRVVLPETRAMLETLAGPFGDDLEGALERACALHPGFPTMLPALFGITIAPTRLKGSNARNVMPGRASVECDCRVLPGQGPADLEQELRDALGDDLPYEIEFLADPTGGTIASIDTPVFRACQGFLDRNDPGAVLLPVVSTGFTDSHFLRHTFGTAAYGFWPSRHTPPEVLHAGAHNRDERIHRDDLGYAVRFHVELVREIAGLGV
jgi:acetylornithine deacetylase/succinyl-diaminopimelate desuccinylase-like protein